MGKIAKKLLELGLSLPPVPAPAGSYNPFIITGKLVYINQVALQNGKILNPGCITLDITEKEAQEAVYVTALNVLSVLQEACNGNLDRVKQAVQLTGFFYTPAGYTAHAALMNIASDLFVQVFGPAGKHARATVGATSLPLNTAIEIQAIFELE